MIPGQWSIQNQVPDTSTQTRPADSIFRYGCASSGPRPENPVSSNQEMLVTQVFGRHFYSCHGFHQVEH
jgi:hypothetical protein